MQASTGRLDVSSGIARRAVPNPGEQMFLRVPPFPGSKVQSLAFSSTSGRPTEALISRLRELRVGGRFWAAQPDLPDRYLLCRSAEALESARLLVGDCPLLLWDDKGSGLPADCDPWHMLSNASELVIDEPDEVCAVAAALEVPVRIFDQKTGELKDFDRQARELLWRAIGATSWRNPFTELEMTASEAIELCGFWRTLIDSNRDLAGGIGFAFWKQAQVAPLLWGGSGRSFHFMNRLPSRLDGGLALWRSRAPAELVAAAEAQQIALVEVEDGFLRSQGLGADCVPPLSITVDRLGAYFDPSGPTELELLLQNGHIDEALLERARHLRRVIVEAGLGKYEAAGTQTQLERPGGERRHVLVAGQVEDDRAVELGGCGLVSNLELLSRVRADVGDAYIIYKPHPDVAAGHRRGAIPEAQCLQYADRVIANEPISSLIEMADAVHVNTSLAGFEALMREKPVTTHGVPFYAGWGLTRDLGAVPKRRDAPRTLDEMVAAVLLMYPRYLDPVSGLPCPAEIIAERLTNGMGSAGLLVTMRRLQGRIMRTVRNLVS